MIALNWLPIHKNNKTNKLIQKVDVKNKKSSNQVANTTSQDTKKTQTTKVQTTTQTTKTQTKQTTNTINTDGYNDCILENMKNISSDEAAIAIKEACKNKHSSQTSSNEVSNFNDNPILIADIPKNLNACGNAQKTRFPIFTDCWWKQFY